MPLQGGPCAPWTRPAVPSAPFLGALPAAPPSGNPESLWTGWRRGGAWARSCCWALPGTERGLTRPRISLCLCTCLALGACVRHHGFTRGPGHTLAAPPSARACPAHVPLARTCGHTGVCVAEGSVLDTGAVPRSPPACSGSHPESVHRDCPPHSTLWTVYTLAWLIRLSPSSWGCPPS